MKYEIFGLSKVTELVTTFNTIPKLQTTTNLGQTNGKKYRVSFLMKKTYKNNITLLTIYCLLKIDTFHLSMSMSTTEEVVKMISKIDYRTDMDVATVGQGGH